MKAGVVLLLLCSALPAYGRDTVRPAPPEALESSEGEASTKPTPLAWRATQVNRCVDAKGKVTLQDLPCTPVVERAASVAADAADVTPLASLEHRPLPEPSHREARDPEMSRFMQGVINGSWKLELFLLFCYGVYWLVGSLRNHLRYRRLQKEIETESMRYSRTRPSQRY